MYIHARCQPVSYTISFHLFSHCIPDLFCKLQIPARCQRDSHRKCRCKLIQKILAVRIAKHYFLYRFGKIFHKRDIWFYSFYFTRYRYRRYLMKPESRRSIRHNDIWNSLCSQISSRHACCSRCFKEPMSGHASAHNQLRHIS